MSEKLDNDDNVPGECSPEGPHLAYANRLEWEWMWMWANGCRGSGGGLVFLLCFEVEYSLLRFAEL